MSQPNLAVRNNLRGFPRLERWLLNQVFKAIGPAPIRLAFKDGEEMAPPGVSPRATIVIQDRPTLIGLMLDPEMAFGEAYSDGRIQVQGDLAEALEVVYKSWPDGADSGWYQRLTSTCMDRLQSNSLDGSRNNIHRHYDLGNDFYRLWLDEQLVYTFCTEMLRTHQLSDATFNATKAKFGERGMVDLIGVMSWYQMVSMSLNADRYPLPDGAKSEFKN